MCGTFRKLPLIAFPHSAAEKFRISASLTVELSFDDLIWLWYENLLFTISGRKHQIRNKKIQIHV